MEMLRYLIAGVLILFGLFVVITNYVRLIANHRNRKGDGRWSSPAPFVGPFFIIIGYLASPFEFSNWVLLAIIADPDTVTTLIRLPHFVKSLRE